MYLIPEGEHNERSRFPELAVPFVIFRGEFVTLANDSDDLTKRRNLSLSLAPSPPLSHISLECLSWAVFRKAAEPELALQALRLSAHRFSEPPELCARQRCSSAEP